MKRHRNAGRRYRFAKGGDVGTRPAGWIENENRIGIGMHARSEEGESVLFDLFAGCDHTFEDWAGTVIGIVESGAGDGVVVVVPADVFPIASKLRGGIWISVARSKIGDGLGGFGVGLSVAVPALYIGMGSPDAVEAELIFGVEIGGGDGEFGEIVFSQAVEEVDYFGELQLGHEAEFLIREECVDIFARGPAAVITDAVDPEEIFGAGGFFEIKLAVDAIGVNIAVIPAAGSRLRNR